jgi:small subunit ribosomal protein S17e
MTIDPHDIIDIGDKLLQRNPDLFTTDFESNKEKVEEQTSLESRRVRNRIAGYVTRKKR